MYGNDIGKERTIVSSNLHKIASANFEIFFYHSNNILTKTVEKLKIFSFQKYAFFEN